MSASIQKSRCYNMITSKTITVLRNVILGNINKFFSSNLKLGDSIVIDAFWFTSLCFSKRIGGLHFWKVCPVPSSWLMKLYKLEPSFFHISSTMTSISEFLPVLNWLIAFKLICGIHTTFSSNFIGCFLMQSTVAM